MTDWSQGYENGDIDGILLTARQNFRSVVLDGVALTVLGGHAMKSCRHFAYQIQFFAAIKLLQR